MQLNVLFFFACLNFEPTSFKDLLSKVAAMRKRGVVFSKMFALRSMGNELVPSRHQTRIFPIKYASSEYTTRRNEYRFVSSSYARDVRTLKRLEKNIPIFIEYHVSAEMVWVMT